MSNGKYAKTLEEAVIEGCVSKETIVYLLKNQLLESVILNQNLKRVVSLLAWKLHVEKANSSIKTELGNMLQKTVTSLENLLTNACKKSQGMRRRLEKLDYEINELKEKVNNNTILHHEQPYIRRLRIRKPIRMATGSPDNNKIAGGSPKSRFISVCHMREGEDKKRNFQNVATQSIEHEEKVEENEVKPIIEEALQTIGEGNIVGANRISNEIEYLHMNYHEAQTELSWHKEIIDQLKLELKKSREQVVVLSEQVTEIKVSSERMIQKENKNWEQLIKTLQVFFSFYYFSQMLITNYQEGKVKFCLFMIYLQNGLRNI